MVCTTSTQRIRNSQNFYLGGPCRPLPSHPFAHAGADQREAVKPLHEKPSEEKEANSAPVGAESDLDADTDDSFTEDL